MRRLIDHIFFLGVLVVTMAVPAMGMSQRTDESTRSKNEQGQQGHHLQIEDTLPAAEAQSADDYQQQLVSQPIPDATTKEQEAELKRKIAAEEARETKMEMDRTPVVTPPPVRPTPPPAPERRPAFLGVHYEMEYGATQGSHVTKVEPGTPAFKAGLKAGDVITHADGVELRNLDDLSQIIGAKKGGDKVRLTYVRAGKSIQTVVTLEDRDENFFRNSLGGPSYMMEEDYIATPGGTVPLERRMVAPATKPASGPLLGVLMLQSETRSVVNGVETVTKTEGALVDQIIPNSAATEIGLRKGDKILVINGKHMRYSTDVTSFVASMAPGDVVEVEYLREGQRMGGTGTLKPRDNYDIPSDEELRRGDVDIKSIGEADPGMLDRMHRMMDEARARATGGGNVARETQVVITMDELSPAEAQAISARSGQQIKPESDLELRGLALSPNPSTGHFHLGFELPLRGNTVIEVMDLSGGIVYAEELEAFQGRYARDFDISQEARGVYVMRILQNGKAFTRKIVTQ